MDRPRLSRPLFTVELGPLRRRPDVRPVDGLLLRPARALLELVDARRLGERRGTPAALDQVERSERERARLARKRAAAAAGQAGGEVEEIEDDLRVVDAALGVAATGRREVVEPPDEVGCVRPA